MITLRFRFSKEGKVRWTSHRDVVRMWERGFRAAGISVAYSEGFSPRPLLSFGLALPTGCASISEYVDARLGREFDGTLEPDCAELSSRLTSTLPAGVDVIGAVQVERGADSLQQLVTSCGWEILVPGVSPQELAESVDRAMASESLMVTRERKGRREHDDVRPSLIAMRAVSIGATSVPQPPPAGLNPISAQLVAEIESGLQFAVGRGAEADASSAVNGGLRSLAVYANTRTEGSDATSGLTNVLLVETATRPRGLRPTELAEALGLTLGPARRTHQWIERDGFRREPIPAQAPLSGPAVEAVL